MKKLKFTPAMFILFLGVFHLLCLSWAFAGTAESSWRMGIAGANAKNSQSSSQFVAFALDTKTKYLAHPDLVLNLDALLKFENGSFQSIDGQRKNESGINLKEAGAHWSVMERVLLSGGALNQATIHSELLIGDRAFPAIRANVRLFEISDLNTQIDVEHATPTSTSLSTNTTGIEAIPRLLSASVSFNLENPRYFWKTRMGSFSYDNLPSAVAYDSSLRGNTVVSLTENESLFVYQYQGLEAVSSLRFPMMRGWDFTAKANYLQNNKASADLNRAYSLSTGSEFFLIGRKSIEVELTNFRIEPDAAVAYFNPSGFFNTNRVGYNIASYLNFKKYNFRVGAAYTEAEVIYLNPVQTREKSLWLVLETFYANI